MAMKWPSSQLKGFITRLVSSSQRLLSVIDAEVVVLVLVQVFSVIHDADAVRRSARSELVRWSTPLTGAGRRLVSRHPSPAVKRRCGIRLDPGGRRHAGTGVGLDVLARPSAVT
jgi:hypothetical protein